MRLYTSKPKIRKPRIGSTISMQVLHKCLLQACLALILSGCLSAQMEFKSDVASLFTDERFFEVGDVITIVINERMQNQNRSQFRSQRANEVEADFGIAGTKLFGIFNPFSGTVESQNDFDSRVQNNKLSSFVTEIGVRVARTDELGNLYIEGSKVIDMPDEKLLVILSGVVRSRDISSNNTINSSQVADLRVTMNGKGEAEEARRPTIFNRILGWFF